VAYVNTFLCESLGFSRDELEGESLDKVLAVSSRILYQNHLYPMLYLRDEAKEIYMTLKLRIGESVPVMGVARSSPPGVRNYPT
jgi:sigma-B regulation protein RsbU (phosphoserine phosphatase)